MKVGVEIGGTFTDLILMDNGKIVKFVKTPSTPSNPAIGALNALAEMGVSLSEIQTIAHGSTVATNTVLERKGANTGLITTKGFRDLLEFQREHKLDIYQLKYKKPLPLIPRNKIVEVNERMDSNGSVIVEINVDDVKRAIQYLIEIEKVDSIAVSLINAYANPSHEQKIRETLSNMDIDTNLLIHLSSEILPEFREYERTSTIVMNAYVAPVMNHYLKFLEDKLLSSDFNGKFYFMQSNGGVLPAAHAREHAVRTLLSGPAAGAMGAANVAKNAGLLNIITVDMGGTSTDVSLIHEGVPKVSTECEIDHLPIRVPMVDIVTVGAGGGSIARIDTGGMLHVGPESAGADPGPACYGKGGTMPTTTDANVVLGLIRPKTFLGGKMELDVAASQKVLGQLADEMNTSVYQAAQSIYNLASTVMANAIRVVSVERGYDPRDYTLLAYGGAGALHAAFLADELECRGVMIPRNPGLLSAYGLLVSDLKRDFVQTDISPGSATTLYRVKSHFATLTDLARQELEKYDVTEEGRFFIPSIDIRYKGQAFELNVEFVLGDLEQGIEWIIEQFHSVHRIRYGHSSPSEEVEFVTYRLTGGWREANASYQESFTGGISEPAYHVNPIYYNSTSMDCCFYARDDLPVGFEGVGPTIIEEYTSTIFVPPNYKFRIDDLGNIFVDRRHGE